MRQIALPDYDRPGFAVAYGPWAVIAGASEGTGSCYAEQLAAMGINLVLVSRRLPALQALAERLTAAQHISCRAIAMDLMEEGAGGRLVENTADLDIGLYISNAGSDGSGNGFLQSGIQRSLALLTMNTRTMTEAIHGFGNRFKQRGRGGVIIMSSCAGLGGQPWLAMYSATKAFELNFAESLSAEMKHDGIDVLGIGAPSMDTPTLRRAVEGGNFDFAMTYNPAEIVHVALASLGKTPVVIFPDGPDADKIPQILADRIERLAALTEWAKSYTGHLYE